MPYTKEDLDAGLAQLRSNFRMSIAAIDSEYQDTVSWLEEIRSGLMTGEIDAARKLLAPKSKTPARRPHLRESSRRGRNLSNVWSTDDSNSGEKSTKSVSLSKSDKSYSRKRSNGESIEEEDSPSKFMRLDRSESERSHLSKILQSPMKPFSPINHADECVRVPVRQSKRISNKQSSANKSSRTPLGELTRNKDLSARISMVEEESEGNVLPTEVKGDSTFAIMATDSACVTAAADSTSMTTTQNPTFGSTTADSNGEVKGARTLPRAARGQTAAIKAARKSLTRAKIVMNKSVGIEDKSKSEKGHLLSMLVRIPSANKLKQTASVVIEKGLTSFISKQVVPTPTNSDAKSEGNLKRIEQRAMEAIKKKDDLIKMQTAEKTRKREQKRQRVLSARDDMERERALKVQQESAAEKALAQKAAAQKAAAQTAAAQKAAAQKAAQKAAAQKAAAEKAAAQKAAAEKAAAQKAAAEKAAAQKAAAEKAAAQKAAAEKAAAQKAAAEKAAAQKATAEKAAAEEAATLDKSEEKLLNQTYDVGTEKAGALNQTFQVNEVKSLDQTYDVGTYDVTLAPEDRKLIPPKTAEDYGLDDVHTDDSSEDEMKPKKVIPKWAYESARLPRLQEQIEVSQKDMAIFFGSKKCTPDLSKIFTQIDQRRLVRRSSAVWITPKK